MYGINTKSFSFPANTDFIFNTNTSISASVKSETGSDGVLVWIMVQEF